MRVYGIQGNVTSGAAAGTYKSFLGIKMANTTGHRGRIRSVRVSGGGGPPQDEQFTARLARSNNTTDGTSTDYSANVAQLDDATIATLAAAVGHNYTVEPTTIDATAVLPLGGANARGQVVKEWGPGEGPEFGIDETILLQVTPGQAVALTLTYAVEWEED